ncbi:MAG: hypothetical protein WB471_15995, partial [Nocardioides sp.]
LQDATSGPRRRELAHALAYWAARWHPLPSVTPRGSSRATDAVARIPPVAEQELGIRHRLAQLPTPGWTSAMTSLDGPARAEDVPAALSELTSAVLGHYATHAHGSPTMLVHAATAPMAVLRTLTALPLSMWLTSFEAAWSASGAVLAAYTPSSPHPTPDLAPGPSWSPPRGPGSAEDVLDQALAHGGEHVIKLADTALQVHATTGAEHPLAAALVAVALDA